MPTKIEIDGEEKEVFTAEELQLQKDAVIEEYKKSNPDRSAELTKLQDELKGFKDKDMNFSNLRTQKEAAEKKVEDILKGVDEKISGVKREVLEGVMLDHKNDILNKLSGGDKELLEKIKLKYDKDLIGINASTKEEVTRKLNDALLLATGNTEGGNSNAFGSGGAGRIKVEANKSPLSEEEKKFAKELAAAGGLKLEDKHFENK